MVVVIIIIIRFLGICVLKESWKMNRKNSSSFLLIIDTIYYWKPNALPLMSLFILYALRYINLYTDTRTYNP